MANDDDREAVIPVPPGVKVTIGGVDEIAKLLRAVDAWMVTAGSWAAECYEAEEKARELAAQLDEARKTEDLLIRERTVLHGQVAKLEADLDAARAEREKALKHCDEYERDWREAKVQFGDAMAKYRARNREMEAALEPLKLAATKAKVFFETHSAPWFSSLEMVAIQQELTNAIALLAHRGEAGGK